MPRGKKHRTLGQVYFGRFTGADPTEIVIIRREVDADRGEWVYLRAPVADDAAHLIVDAPTNQGRTLRAVVERSDTLYLRETAPTGWETLSVAQFGLAGGEVFAVADMNEFDEVEGDDEVELPMFDIGSPGPPDPDLAPPAAPLLAVAPAAAYVRDPGLVAAPAYAGGIGGPPPWVLGGRRRSTDAAAAPPTELAAQDWALIAPHIAAAVQTALRPELEQLTSRMSQLEVGQSDARLHAPVVTPGEYFAPPARAPPTPAHAPLPSALAPTPLAPPAYAPYGVPSVASADAAAVAEARALLSGTVSARAATSQMLSLSAPSTGRAAGGGTALTLAKLIQMLESRDDIGSLLGSDEVLGGVGGASGAKGLAALERARLAFEAHPRTLWDFVMAQVTRLTRVGGGGLLAYFRGTAVQNDEMALFLLHLVERISVAALAGDGDMVLGLCGSAITFLDQAARDSFSLTLATDLSLIRDPELPYLGPATDADKRLRARYGKPFSPLVDPSTYAAVVAALKDLDVLTKAAAAAKGKGKGKA
jgi:hypothetical protein